MFGLFRYCVSLDSLFDTAFCLLIMNYKGFIGVVEYDENARIFSGEVINTRTVITFQGTTVDEIEQEFHASVDDYLEWCKEDGVEPEKGYRQQWQCL